MPSDHDIYSIVAVRLVNFHNISHVTIPIQDGGHLFLLGDNGSGKTTVLDAIHYVLSAGELELNSAARLGGNKQDGRRIHGVITAYNVDLGGPRFPEGRVTYVALELRNGVGNRVCIGVGLSLSGANAPLQQWGFKMSRAIEELPLLIRDDDGAEYPPDREALQKILKRKDSGGAYYTSMVSFAQMLAREYFPTQPQYDEYRKFLNMCKAYREISSRAGNYHELFKSLLPEPDVEIVRELRNSLRNLRESSSALFELEKKSEFLAGLVHEKQQIEKNRQELQLLESGVLYYDWQRARKTLAEEAEKQQLMADHVDELEGQQGEAQKRIATLERSLADLRGRDALNLVETEAQRSRELRLQEQDYSLNQQALNGARAAAENLTAERRQKLENFQRCSGTLSGKIAEHLQTWQELPLQEALNALQQIDYRNVSNDMALRGLRDAFGGAEERCKQQRSAAAEAVRQVKAVYEQIRLEVVALERQPEALPTCVDNYGQLLQELEQRMIHVDTLYAKLHWKADVPAAVKSAVEELIGEAALATLVTERETLEAVKSLLLERYPRARCAELEPPGLPQPSERIRDFLSMYFDEGTDGAYLQLLARELSGIDTPWFDIPLQPKAVTWRGAYRVLSGRPAKLIGEEERKAEQARRLAEARERLTRQGEAVSQADAEREALDRRLESLRRFAERYQQLFADLQMLGDGLMANDCNLQQANAAMAEGEKKQSLLTEQLEQLRSTIEQLRAQIVAKDLDKLAGEIQRVQRQLDEARGRYAGIHDMLTAEQTKLETQTLIRQGAQEALATVHGQLDGHLKAMTPVMKLETLEKHLAERELGSSRACMQALDAPKTAIGVSIGTINSRINGPEGRDFGFSYDHATNELYSRDHRTVGDIYTQLRDDLDKQHEILTEETHRNFEHILFEKFRTALRTRIFRLENMEVQINRKLKGHAFGMNSYSLKITPLPEYTPLIKILKAFTFQTAENSDELKEIFTAHANEILETPPNYVPPILDYRNYFRYDMVLHTLNQDGKIMDSRTKSIGSGGEQAVPNYLLVMMIAHLLFDKTEGTNSRIKINTILFDEAFYGIDNERQNQLLAFAEELGLQLMIASPNQDGIKPELAHSTNVFVRKDKEYQVHLFCYNWRREQQLFENENDIPPGAELV